MHTPVLGHLPYIPHLDPAAYSVWHWGSACTELEPFAAASHLEEGLTTRQLADWVVHKKSYVVFTVVARHR